MALRFKRGMGDVTTTPPNFCNNRFAWAIPACWAWTRPLTYGDNYPEPPRPPNVGSTLSGGSEIPAVPASAYDASAVISDLTDQQIAAWQAQNQRFFEQLNPQVNPPGTNWLLWLAGGLAVAGIFLGGR